MNVKKEIFYTFFKKTKIYKLITWDEKGLGNV